MEVRRDEETKRWSVVGDEEFNLLELSLSRPESNELVVFLVSLILHFHSEQKKTLNFT